jgi:hypothetical protein
MPVDNLLLCLFLAKAVPKMAVSQTLSTQAFARNANSLVLPGMPGYAIFRPAIGHFSHAPKTCGLSDFLAGYGMIKV